MPKCPRCHNGKVYGEEDGHQTVDDCIHCLGKGEIPEDLARMDAIEDTAQHWAAILVARRRKAIDENPDGEDFAFHAAENMMSPTDYQLSLRIEEFDRIMRLLQPIEENHPALLNLLVELAGANQNAPSRDTMRIAVTGTVELQNGLTLEWLRFIEMEDIKAEAVRIVKMQHGPSCVKRCFAH